MVFALFGICLSIPCSAEIQGIPVLVYHQIGTTKDAPKVDVISLERFQEQMKYLADNKYTTINMHELVAYIKKGGNIPKKVLFLILMMAGKVV